jgi:hypothetical protein
MFHSFRVSSGPGTMDHLKPQYQGTWCRPTLRIKKKMIAINMWSAHEKLEETAGILLLKRIICYPAQKLSVLVFRRCWVPMSAMIPGILCLYGFPWSLNVRQDWTRSRSLIVIVKKSWYFRELDADITHHWLLHYWSSISRSANISFSSWSVHYCFFFQKTARNSSPLWAFFSVLFLYYFTPTADIYKLIFT